MREKNAGLTSNLKKVDQHKISSAEYDEIPGLPESFFTDGQLYRDGKSVERRTRGKQKHPTKEQLTIRLNKEVVTYFKSRGKGWQTRVNEVLQEYVDSHH